MASSNVFYKIRCTIIGHSMDVRAVAVSEKGDILTASRDQTAKLWSELEENRKEFTEKVVYRGHSGYVSSACLIPPLESHPDGLTVTGSRDSKILVFPRYFSEAIHSLTGHTDTVSCLFWCKDILISGSWDHTVRIWKNWKQIAEYKEHTGPVWAVSAIDLEDGGDPLILTASADKTIKSWRDSKVRVTYTGHADCIRSLAIVNRDKFLSCSNDASVKLWQLSGTCLGTYYGHNNFIYSVFALAHNEGFITGGEDRSMRVWSSSGENIETLFVPTQSVWAVAVLPNSDIVCGSSDGICRVFTRSLDRQADEKDRLVYAASIAQSKISIEDLGGIKITDLPEKNFLLSPGKKNGQTVMVRDGEKVLCYNWSASKFLWEPVGEVVGGTGGSPGSSGKVLHNGKEYDFVFDVDLDEGRMIKLPYNKGDDQWMVAQKFIHEHELPQDYLDQIAKFITKNAGVSSTSSSLTGYHDPFTGGSRYVPQGMEASTSNGVSDPLTGVGRYVPQNTAVPKFSSCYFPQSTPLIFESVNKEGMMTKFTESNSLVTDKLTSEEVSNLIDCVTAGSANPGSLSPLEVALQWPIERVWPALDVLRLALKSLPIQERWITEDKGPPLLSLLVGLLKPPLNATAHLLALRCLSNMASNAPGRCLLATHRAAVLSASLENKNFPNKNLEIAAATLVLNYCVIFMTKGDLSDRCQALSAAMTLVLTVADNEALFRALVAIGTVVSVGEKERELAKTLDVEHIVDSFASSSVLKVSECASHIMKAMQ